MNIRDGPILKSFRHAELQQKIRERLAVFLKEKRNEERGVRLKHTCEGFRAQKGV